MTHFFISYTKADEPWTKWIRWVLQGAQHTVETQEQDFKAGENFMIKMREAFDKDGKTILVYSSAFFRSDFAQMEASAAMVSDPIGHQRKVIPVMVEHCVVPTLFRPTIYIDLSDISDEQQARGALLSGITGEGNQSGERPPFPGHASEPARFPRGSVGADTGTHIFEGTRKPQDVRDVDAEGFLKDFDFNDVKSIDVSALTGGMTVRAVVNQLRRARPPSSGRKIPLHILFKSPKLSDRKRANDVAATVNDLKTLPAWIEPEVRYFAAPAVLRSIVLHHEDTSYTAFLSFYDWKHPENVPNRGAHSDYADARKRAPADRLLAVYESWFQHYWGRHKLHTIIFDFDDTLFFTTEARVAAWNKAIVQGLSDKGVLKSELSRVVRDAHDAGELEKALTEIFFDKQEDDDMLDLVFAKTFRGDRRAAFVERRRKVRAEETVASAREISDITRYLPQLRNDYQLVIVSGTSESVVESVLGRHGLAQFFSFIVGSEAPTQNWESIERKTQNLLRVSAMLGVPLNRCVFIGDSDTDYRSAHQLDLPFVENRLNAARLRRPSLIRNPAKDAVFITGQDGPSELVHLIERIEATIQ